MTVGCCSPVRSVTLINKLSPSRTRPAVRKSLTARQSLITPHLGREITGKVAARAGGTGDEGEAICGAAVVRRSCEHRETRPRRRGEDGNKNGALLSGRLQRRGPDLAASTANCRNWSRLPWQRVYVSTGCENSAVSKQEVVPWQQTRSITTPESAALASLCYQLASAETTSSQLAYRDNWHFNIMLFDFNSFFLFCLSSNGI